MTERFGTLRSILQRPPNKQTWDALCEELALWDTDALERDAVPYALSHLDRWPDDLARATSRGALFDWRATGRIYLEDYTQNGEAEAILLTSPHLHPTLRAHLQARQR